MDRERWNAVRGILFAGLGSIVALVGITMGFVFHQASLAHEAAVDRCHDAGGGWLPAGPHSYAGRCLRGPETPPWPTPKP